MKRREMLLKLQHQLEILKKRRDILEDRLKYIDNLPNEKINKDTYNRWHSVYCKLNYINLRIETIRSKMELLSDTDIIKAVISSSKGLFNFLRRAN